MKTLIIAAVLGLGGTSIAHAQTDMQPQTSTQTDPNGPNMSPGDGVTRMGTTPAGQPYTPSGFNQNMNVYPAAAMAPGAMPGMMEYPRCSRQVTDRCVQAYAMQNDKPRRARRR